MSDYLYKAFAPCDDGKEQIWLDGKSIKGDWVCGNLLKIPYDANGNSDYYIIKNVDWRDTIYEIHRYSYQVIPETICAAIPGLKDSNGKQVFNHDLLTLNKLLGVYEVRWHEAQCRYDLYLDGHPVSGCNPDTIKNYEVIGTIFDKENN